MGGRSNKTVSMRRTDFIKGIGVAGLVAAGLSSCQQSHTQDEVDRSADRSYKWKMVTTWPPNFPILGEGLTQFATWIEEMSRGQFTIHIYGGGELVPALETFEAVSIGGIELGSSASYYWAGKIPAAQFFAAVPFGFNAQQMNTWLSAGGGMDLWNDLYAPYNLIPFNAGNTGLQMGGWYNKEINSIADFQGLKMRMPGLGGKVLKKVGGSPILSPGSEIYTNLERGVIDATEWLGPYHDSLMGFPDIAKYYYYPGWHECGTTLEMIANKKKFEALPPHLKSIFNTAVARLRSWVLDEFEYRNAEALALIRKAGKVDIRAFPDDVIKELKIKTKETLDELAANNKETDRVYQSFLAHAVKSKNWSELSEASYYKMTSAF